MFYGGRKALWVYVLTGLIATVDRPITAFQVMDPCLSSCTISFNSQIQPSEVDVLQMEKLKLRMVSVMRLLSGRKHEPKSV